MQSGVTVGRNGDYEPFRMRECGKDKVHQCVSVCKRGT